jgi:hypothetical protein
MQDFGYELRRIYIPRTRVNKPTTQLAPSCNCSMQQKSLIWGMRQSFGERMVGNDIGVASLRERAAVACGASAPFRETDAPGL